MKQYEYETLVFKYVELNELGKKGWLIVSGWLLVSDMEAHHSRAMMTTDNKLDSHIPRYTALFAREIDEG